MLLDNHHEEIDEDSEASNEDNEGGNIAKKGTQKKTNYFFVKLLDSYSKHAMAKEYNITEKN